jgi:DHA1 family bicyclomycin/chloramphenicol resistance-like MFS transporter
MADSSHNAGKTSSRTGLVILLGSLAAMGPFAIDTYLPAFPEIARDFGTDVAHIGLSLSSYFLGICLGQLFYGPILDRYGRRTPLLWGLAIFAAASVLCAFAPSSEALIALRFVQALGGCAGMVAGRALVRDLFPDDAADVFSSLMLVMGVAPIIAPAVGGWLTAFWGWPSIFLFLAVVSLVVTFAIATRLPTVHVPNEGQTLHPVEVARGYLAIFRDRTFLAWGLSGSLVSGGLFAYIAGSPAVYMDLFGMSKATFSWVFGINAMGLIGASQVNRVLLKRFSSERISSVVLVGQCLAGLGLVASAWLHFAPGVYLLVWLFLFGQGFAFPNTSALAMRPFGVNAGSASALLGSLQMAAGAILSGVVSMLPGGTALPMAIGMALSAIGALALLWIFREPH